MIVGSLKASLFLTALFVCLLTHLSGHHLLILRNIPLIGMLNSSAAGLGSPYLSGIDLIST